MNRSANDLIFYLAFIAIPWEFSHHFEPMVFHWRLSDRESFQLSRTLLIILANLDNAVVLMLSTCLISQTSSLFSKTFGDCSERSYYNWYHRHLHHLQFFLVLWQGISLSVFFFETVKSTYRQFPLFSFFVDYHHVLFTSQD